MLVFNDLAPIFYTYLMLKIHILKQSKIEDKMSLASRGENLQEDDVVAWKTQGVFPCFFAAFLRWKTGKWMPKKSSEKWNPFKVSWKIPCCFFVAKVIKHQTYRHHGYFYSQILALILCQHKYGDELKVKVSRKVSVRMSLFFGGVILIVLNITVKGLLFHHNPCVLMWCFTGGTWTSQTLLVVQPNSWDREISQVLGTRFRIDGGQRPNQLVCLYLWAAFFLGLTYQTELFFLGKLLVKKAIGYQNWNGTNSKKNALCISDHI